MAEDIRHFTVTCPPGVPQASAELQSLALPPRVVTRIDWRVPNGPMGTMGFLLAMGGVPVLPVTTFTYVLANDETGFWEPTGYPDSGAWQCSIYNTGANPHSVYLTFHTDNPVRPSTVVPLIDPVMLMPAPDLSRAGPPVQRRP